MFISQLTISITHCNPVTIVLDDSLFSYVQHCTVAHDEMCSHMIRDLLVKQQPHPFISMIFAICNVGLSTTIAIFMLMIKNCSLLMHTVFTICMVYFYSFCEHLFWDTMQLPSILFIHYMDKQFDV